MKPKLKLDNVNLRSLNFMGICRFCLSDEGILLPIFEPKPGKHPYELPTQIKTILSVEVEKEDGLPSMICHSCFFNLEQSVDFKNQCEQADSILRNYINNKDYKENCKNPFPDVNKIIDADIDHEKLEENSPNQMIDTGCQAEVREEVTGENPEVETDVRVGSPENHNDLNGKAEPAEDGINQEEGNDNQLEIDANAVIEVAAQMEESMNDLDEGMFGNEPFSLDLCSVRLQSEGQAPEDVVLYPGTQLTDDDPWTDSGSEISDEFEAGEQISLQATPGSSNCSSCNKAFPSGTDLERHQLIHKQEPPYPCDYCDKEFLEKSLLKAHWRAHARNKPHMCLTCGEAYMERSQLVKHFAIHDLIKPYHCLGCGKAFAYRSDLRKHAIIHTGARPFKCPVCSKTFTRSTNLNKHARVHSGRRPYPCEHCDKMFSSRGDLVRHAVIHTGEKPYACLICSLAFNRKDKLSRHERVHMTDRPFVCAECPTSFHRKEELTKHSRFHHFKPDPEYYNSTE